MTDTPRIKSYEEQLIEVQQAISDILSGAQEAKREEYLQNKVAQKRRGGIRVRGATPC